MLKANFQLLEEQLCKPETITLVSLNNNHMQYINMLNVFSFSEPEAGTVSD